MIFFSNEPAAPEAYDVNDDGYDEDYEGEEYDDTMFEDFYDYAWKTGDLNGGRNLPGGKYVFNIYYFKHYVVSFFLFESVSNSKKMVMHVNKNLCPD